MPTPICWSTLQIVGSISLSSIDEHCLSIDDICFDRILFTFLATETSDSSFWKFSFKGWISVVSEAIVVLAYSWILRNESIILFLFNVLSVSAVYTPAITSTRLLQWQKIAVKYKCFTLFHIRIESTSRTYPINHLKLRLGVHPYVCTLK